MGVFEYKPGRTSHTSKVTQTSLPATSDTDLYPGVNADPFIVKAGEDPALLASWLADAGVWSQQHVSELAALACRARNLADKLLCPSLANDPHRPAAVHRSEAMDEEVIDTVRVIVLDEARADRVWQSLTPDQRESTYAPYWWGCDATHTRLIGQAWFAHGQLFSWPRGFRINRQWLGGLPLTAVMDLRIHKVLDWTPNPHPEMFSDELNEAIPMDIARQIADSRGHAR